MLNSTEHEISTAHTNTIATNEEVICVNSDVVFIMLTNVKMPTIVDILTFMDRINFVLSSTLKCFITLPDLMVDVKCLYRTNPPQSSNF